MMATRRIRPNFTMRPGPLADEGSGSRMGTMPRMVWGGLRPILGTETE